METNQQTNAGAETPQPQVSAKANWDAVFGSEDVVATTTEPVNTESEQTKDTTTTNEPEPATKLEVEKTEDKADEAKVEDKKDELTVSDALELKVEDIKDLPKTYEENSYQKLAYDALGIELKENTPAALKSIIEENYVSKSQLDEVKSLTTEKLLSTLRPDVATAFQLVQMGVPEELAFNPTKEIDAYLALEDAVLVRSALEAKEGYGEAEVDLEMEQLSENPAKLAAAANIARANLNADKKAILQERDQIVQKYTEQKKNEAIALKTEQDTRFKEVLSNEKAFLGLGLSKEVKAHIENKYSRGAYDDILNNPTVKLTAILHHEFGDKFTKTALSKAKEEGKAEIVQKLSNVEPKAEQGGGSRVQSSQPSKGGFDFLRGD